MKRVITSLGFALAILAAGTATVSADSFRPELGLRYYALRESNIYHAYEDTSEVASMLNVVESEAVWKRRLSHRFEHRATAYADFDLYPNYSNRNKSSIGAAYAPEWRYTHDGRLSLNFDFSRRNKDLIDDTGQSLTRTLKRWDTDFELTHRYDFDRVRTELSFIYYNANYDETDTLATNGIDTMMVHLLSYDYHALSWRGRVRYEPTQRIETRLTFTTEGRSYDERRTYTVQYGAVKGRPFEVRTFRENTVEARVAYKIRHVIDIALETEFSRRKDNFENFYGYDQWQHKLGVDIEWSRRQATGVTFRFKTKAYENYYTSRIRPGDQVSIDYADFQLEHEYALTPRVSLRGYLRNYNKVSNDPYFDYHDLSGGVGFAFSY